MANGRCRVHGGPNKGAKKGNKSAYTHGIYSKALTDEEKANYDKFKVGDLDEEIKLVKIQAKRAAERLLELEENPESEEWFELSEVRTSSELSSDKKEVTKKEYIKKRENMRYLLDRWLARLGKLEETRAKLSGLGNPDDPDEFARNLLNTVRQMEKVEQGEVS